MAKKKPNMKEFMDATGVEANEASEILYGTIGANEDTRDWDAIMSSSDPVQASIEANLSQYSSGAATKNTNKEEYPTFSNPDGTKAGIVKTDTGFALVSVDGVPLRAGFGSLDQAKKAGKFFGITDFLGDSSETTTVVNRPASPSSPSVPSTPIATVGAGQAADVNSLPQTVTQQVTPPVYNNQPQVASPTGQATGTFSSPLQTAGFSAVPQQITYKTQYAGTPGNVPEEVAPQASGVRVANYVNQFGSTIPVTEVNGVPQTAVPPGYVRKSETQVGTSQPAPSPQLVPQPTAGMAEGGMVSGFQPQQAASILSRVFGYQGPADSNSIQQFLSSNPGAAARMGKYQEAMDRMRTPNTGMAEGGDVEEPEKETTPPNPALERLQQAQQNLVGQAAQPISQSVVTPLVSQPGQYIPVDAGQTVPVAPFAEAATIGNVEQANMPQQQQAAQTQAATSSDQMQQLTQQSQAAQGAVSPDAMVQAAQQGETAVSQLEAAQGTAFMMNNPVQREIQEGELISGSAVDAAKVSAVNEQVQAATASPSQKATVQGQLEGLMQQFEGGNTPAWAAASMRNAQAVLAERGLGASSLAGQAVIQATMESAFPIAQADAQTRAQFETQNLSNRQQAAMVAAEQRARFLGQEFDQEFQSRVQNSARIADIANRNFTAEQQVALENSRAANTMNLNNLNNRQALVMSEAAALAQLDTQNLNNRQQAAVQNAQNFLQMDMQNLNNEQQMAMFDSQQLSQALFSDQAAENASRQFNASSENQTNQFFANLSQQTSQFNAAQRNALDQFNVSEVNALREFNSEIQQQRDMFNAQNGLVISQANAQWRQTLDTLNTQTQNEANMQFSKTLNALSAGTLDEIWQRERDVISYAWQGEQNQLDRDTSVLLGDKKIQAADESGKGSVVGNIVAEVGSSLVSSIFG